MKLKIFLYILIAVAIIAVAAFAVYQLIHSGSNNSAGVSSQAETGSLPVVPNQQLPTGGQTRQAQPVAGFNASAANASSSHFGIVSNDPALDYFIDAANTVTLIKPDGTLESIAGGKINIISTSTISNIITAAFSYDGKKIFASSRVGTTTQTSVFDLGLKVWTRLPNNMQSPVWSPVNYHIAYLAPSNSGFETLATIDTGIVNTKPATITSLAMEDMSLQWPDQNTIIISDRPSAYVAGSIWSFTISSKTLSGVVYENLGAESVWSASGTALIFSAGLNNSGGRLAFQDIGGFQKTLSFVTLPSKCAFGPAAVSSSTMNPAGLIYCAVPNDQNTLSVARLPDEYDQKIYFTDDDFYSIDSNTGALTKVLSFSTINQNLDATRMKVLNNILFFINRYDQKIYALAL